MIYTYVEKRVSVTRIFILQISGYHSQAHTTDVGLLKVAVRVWSLHTSKNNTRNHCNIHRMPCYLANTALNKENTARAFKRYTVSPTGCFIGDGVLGYNQILQRNNTAHNKLQLNHFKCIFQSTYAYECNISACAYTHMNTHFTQCNYCLQWVYIRRVINTNLWRNKS